MYTPRSPFLIKLEQQDARMTWQRGLLFSLAVVLAYLAINALLSAFDAASGTARMIVLGCIATIVLIVFLRHRASRSNLPFDEYICHVLFRTPRGW